MAVTALSLPHNSPARRPFICFWHDAMVLL